MTPARDALLGMPRSGCSAHDVPGSAVYNDTPSAGGSVDHPVNLRGATRIERRL
jgi:hypothetical protein